MHGEVAPEFFRQQGRTGLLPGPCGHLANGVGQQDGAVHGHVPMVALPLVEFEQGPPYVLDMGDNVQGGFEEENG